MINQKLLNDLPHDFVLHLAIKPETHLDAYTILDQFHSKGICITLNKPASNLKDALERKGFSTENLYFIDAVSNLAGIQKNIKNCSFVNSPADLTGIGIALDNIVAKIGQEAEKFLILDSLPTLSIYHKEDTVLQFLNFLINRMRALRIKGFIFNIEENVSKKINNELDEFCDKTIRL